jgi:hypothetical protein
MIMKGEFEDTLRGLAFANRERVNNEYARGFADALSAVATSCGVNIGYFWPVADEAELRR